MISNNANVRRPITPNLSGVQGSGTNQPVQQGRQLISPNAPVQVNRTERSFQNAAAELAQRFGMNISPSQAEARAVDNLAAAIENQPITEWVEAPSLDAVRNGNATLSRGMQGPAVTQLQTLLGLPFTERDGFLGDITAEAIMNRAVSDSEFAATLGPDGEITGASLAALQGAAFSNINDILLEYTATGMSAEHAQGAGVPVSGVAGSEQLVNADMNRLLAHEEAIAQVALDAGIPPAIFAALISRETRAGLLIERTNGWGDPQPDGSFAAYGVGQVDRRFHTPDTTEGFWGMTHLRQSMSILSAGLRGVEEKHPDWPRAQQLRGALVAYNAGLSTVQSIPGMDRGTHRNDYSNDVWARAVELVNNGHFQVDGTPSTPIDPPIPPVWTQAPAFAEVLATQLTANPVLITVGMQSEEIAQVQEWLGFTGDDVDGKFGELTENAVRRFQEAQGISTSTPGALDGATIRKLNEINQSPIWSPAPSLEAVKNSEGTATQVSIRKFHEGPSVEQLQKWLGFVDENVDGKFGTMTEDGLRAFQAEHGLRQTGVGDAATIRKFEEIEAGQNTWIAAPSLDAVRSGDDVLRRGMEGPAVVQIQQWLGLPADGKFGEQTQAAVRNYQINNGLNPDRPGVVDGATVAKMEEARDRLDKGVRFTLSGSVGRGGANNPDDVRKVRQRLTELGFPVEQRGLDYSIQLFQTAVSGAHQLSGDGRVDPNGFTHSWLMAANSPEWIMQPKGGVGLHDIDFDGYSYGTSWAAEATLLAGQLYAAANPNGTPIRTNDRSTEHGGPNSDHSTHQAGMSLDTSPPFFGWNDSNLTTPITWRSGNYDRESAKAQLRAFWATGMVEGAFFNDPQIRNDPEFSSWVTFAGGHDNHFHFYFKVPGQESPAPDAPVIA